MPWLAAARPSWSRPSGPGPSIAPGACSGSRRIRADPDRVRKGGSGSRITPTGSPSWISGGAVDGLGDPSALVHHLGERGGRDRLRAVAHRVLGVVVDL